MSEQPTAEQHLDLLPEIPPMVDEKTYKLAEHFLTPKTAEHRVQQLAQAIQAAVEDFLIYPTTTCPKCQREDTDMDGFGFLACSSCGYCTHPSSTEGKCGICGAVTGSKHADRGTALHAWVTENLK